MTEVAEKQYISTHVVGKKVTGFQVKAGRVILELDGGGVLEVGARMNSLSFCYQGSGTIIEE